MAKKKYSNTTAASHTKSRDRTRQHTRKANRFHDNAFDTQLAAYGLHIRPVAADGNCMFSSVADQVYGETDRHADVRDDAAKYMHDHRDDFKMFCEHGEDKYDDYVKRMSRLGCWGDYTVLNAVCRVYNVNVVIWQLNASRMEINNVTSDQHTRTIHISYHDESHYASVRNIGDNLSEQPTPIRIAGAKRNNNKDAAAFDIDALSEAERTVYEQTQCTDTNMIRGTLTDCGGDIDAALQLINAELQASNEADAPMQTSDSNGEGGGKQSQSANVLSVNLQPSADGLVSLNLQPFGYAVLDTPQLVSVVARNIVKPSSPLIKPRSKLRKRDLKQLKKQEKAMKRKQKQATDVDLDMHTADDGATLELTDKLGSIII